MNTTLKTKVEQAIKLLKVAEQEAPRRAEIHFNELRKRNKAMTGGGESISYDN